MSVNYEEELRRLQQQNANASTQGTNINMQSMNQQSMAQAPEVSQAQQYLQNVVSNRPADYKSQWADNIKSVYDEIMSRPKFSYNPQDDPLYGQMKNLYMQNGQQAMRDASATAAGLTGGYGNSYANMAGNQVYQDYVRQLNAILPEMEQNAYARYGQEGQDMLNRLNVNMGMDESDYAKYRDQMNDYLQGQEFGLQERESAYNQAISMLTAGMMPGDELLNKAGMTREQAQSYLNNRNAAYGTGSGAGKKKEFSITDTVHKIMNKAVAKYINGDFEKSSSNDNDKFRELLKNAEDNGNSSSYSLTGERGNGSTQALEDAILNYDLTKHNNK